MTLPSWPADLGRPLLDGLSFSRDDVRQFASAERGPPRVRRRISKASRSATVSFRFTPDQRARFWRFFDVDTAEGSAPFVVPAWGNNDLELLTSEGLEVLTHDGAPVLLVSSWLCLFGSTMPSEVPFGGDAWRTSFDLVILP